MRKTVAAALITGSLLTGGAIGSALLGAGPATAQSSSSDSSSSSAPAPPAGDPGFRDGRHGPHPHPNLDLAASTIGVTADDLRSALESGQSVADVATAHNVDPQTVIDALVADAQSKLDERVTNGDLTQEQADAIKADLPQRIADFVNHAGLPEGPGGPGRHGDCPGMDGPGTGTGSGSGSDQGSSSGSDSSSSSGSSSASNSGTSFAA
jgi:hypothetical protein